MTRLVLAGDIGGTHSRLALFDTEEGGRLVAEVDHSSVAIGDFASVAADFVRSNGRTVVAAAIGAAGPILEQTVKITNLPWGIEATAVSRALGGVPVRLLNDLEAMAHGSLAMGDDDLAWINRGQQRPGHRVVLAAGTGLGQALLFWNGRNHAPAGSEGGHADFAPRDPREMQLLRFLLREHGRVDWERILSGPGLHNLYRFVTEEEGIAPSAAVVERLTAGQDAGAVIGEAGVSGACPACAAAVELFASLYGAQAGNFALTALALNGVYIGGAMAVHLLPKLSDGAFLRAFQAKEPFVELMSSIPVAVITNPQVNLIGAGRVAAGVGAG